MYFIYIYISIFIYVGGDTSKFLMCMCFEFKM